MKVRESGMPEEELWEGFFEPEQTLRKLGISEDTRDVADLGCGYGTFSLAAAHIVKGTVYAIDLEEEMIDRLNDRAKELGLENIKTIHRDFIEDDTGLGARSVNAVFLFNILHGEEPKAILKEAFRILAPGGIVVITHWIKDHRTPRGPPMDMRIEPQEIMHVLREIGFSQPKHYELGPWHFGLVAKKT